MIQISEKLNSHISDGDHKRSLMSLRESTIQCFLMTAGYLVVAIIVGGLFGQILSLAGVMQIRALVFGFGAGVLVSAASYLRHTSNTQSAHRATSSDLSGVILVVRISNITSVAEVDDLDDFGPGYVLRTAEEERVFIAGQVLWENCSENSELVTETLVLYVDADTHSLVKAERHGCVIESTGSCSVGSLSIDPTVGFSILI